MREKNYPGSFKFPKVVDVLKAKSKQLKSMGLGNLPLKSDAITNTEIKALFDYKGAAGIHNPRALNNAMAITCSFLGFRGGTELYNRCLGDLQIKTIDGERFLSIVNERVTKTRNGEKPRDMLW